MYSREELQQIFRRLAEPFPEEAVERTRGDVTRKGYDTTGIKYQYVVNRLNEVLGVGGFRVDRDFKVSERQTRNGNAAYEVTCDLTMQLGGWDEGRFVPFAEATGTGGHISTTEANAKKGAFTNGFKKVAAFFGCGWQAYAGCIDDDNVPADDSSTQRDAHHHESTSHHERSRHSAQRRRDSGNTGNGRITSAQLAKLRELVDQVEHGDWNGFCQRVREEHGVVVEYADRRLASDLIGELIDRARSRRGNGDSRRP